MRLPRLKGNSTKVQRSYANMGRASRMWNVRCPVLGAVAVSSAPGYDLSAIWPQTRILPPGRDAACRKLFQIGVLEGHGPSEVPQRLLPTWASAPEGVSS